VAVLLLATYEMGRQPFGLASPAAWLREAGLEVMVCDLSRQSLDPDSVRRARLVACYLPMHTATRLVSPVVSRIRRLNPRAVLCAYGLYAPLNATHLRELGFDVILGPEFEADLAALAQRVAAGVPIAADAAAFHWKSVRGAGAIDGGARRSSPSANVRPASAPSVARLAFRVPDRSGLPPLARYASLHIADERRLVGYTEATRGCKHRCRHCPVVPVYDGRFRVVPVDVVVEDARRQVAEGARHITFGDPDFLNGPRHAAAVMNAFARACPGVSYDVTIKIEHILRHADLLPCLKETGCLFVTSAVESIDDRVLRLLDKGHTRADFVEAVALTRQAGVTLVPTFVAFHPWLTLDGYCELLETIAELDLVDHVAPIQLAIRLLLPEGSPLLTLTEMRRHVGAFDPATLAYRWTHPDPRVDLLQREIIALVGARLTAGRRDVFEQVRALACEFAGRAHVSAKPIRDRATVPYLNEPWYC
jgi:radical SAM superfamily enzyme YgiQ (UPF0313 family)